MVGIGILVILIIAVLVVAYFLDENKDKTVD